MRAAISGWGTALPDGRLTNADLERMVDTTDAWIFERTGIRERRRAGAGETTATLATAAGAAAIKQARLTPGDVDLLIVATTTPEQPVPHTSAIVQAGLGVGGGAFDVTTGCSGFVYALVVGALVQQAGGLDAVLVVGAETLTRTIVDFSDRATCVLFGDGAGAVVLRPAAGPDPPGLLGWDLGCDGSGAELIEVRAGGSRLPATPATLAAGEQWVKMDGPEVYRRAVRVMAESSSLALRRAGMTAADVDLFVPHQANGRIIDATARRLGVPPERTARNVDRFGNTSAASVPLALAEAADAGRLQSGDVVVLSAVGAGLGWASAVLRWGDSTG